MADFDDRFSAATEGQDGPFDERFKRAATMPQSDPIPGLVHGAIPGIRGVVANGAPDQEDKPTPGIWSPGGPGPAKALGTWMRGRTIADDPFNVFPAGLPDKNVQHDNRLSEKPSRTDEPIGLPSQFGPGSMMGMPPLAGGGPTAPWPGTQPSTPPAPPPQQPAPRPAPQMAQPSMAPQSPYQAPAVPPGPPPGVPAQDKSIIPQDSLLGRIMSGANTWRDQNRLTLMAMAGGLAGSQSLGQGLGRAFTAAVPAMQADQAQQNQNSTASLLMNKIPNLTPEQARGLAGNKEFMSQFLGQAFGTKPRQHIQTTDAMGNPMLLSFDQGTGKFYDVSGHELGAGGASVPGMSGGVSDPSLHGEEYLKAQKFNSEFANQVRSIANGNQPFPTGRAAMQGHGLALSQAVTQYDPDVTAQTYQQRQQAYNNWYGKGDGAKTYQALNQLTDHMESMAQSIDQLGNWSLGRAANTLPNEVGHFFGGAIPYQDVKENVHALADEMSKLWKGSGHATDSEIKAWEEAFPVNGSKQQQKAYLKKGMDLVNGAMDSLDTRRKNELGKASERMPDPVPEGVKERLDRVKSWTVTGEGANQKSRTIPAAPKVGEIRDGYRYKGGDPAYEKSWERVK